ncbi:MAG: peptidase M16 [Halieaceae bacterium]|nr:peptidase M16 [Halieaceae bacterium]
MHNDNTTLPDTHPAFEAVHQETIDSLNVRVEHYRHRGTGAVHYHLSSESTENVFLVALRTVPEDSTGVAHILEHTALCGSERFPVRDPFFMMLRRSLNTFMNAFTSSDWTAYPFASQNTKDFNNLLEVYLDAVFFSRLDPLDFAQEGHRVEFSQPDDPTTDLVFKGVVYNEMKGAMSAVSTSLWNKLCEELFPTTTYHYSSGGDPQHIPDLSYEQLKTFYTSHYHPSNAIFMTFGNIPASEHQSTFEHRALGRFQKLDQRIQVPAQQRLTAPIRISDTYAYDDSGECASKTHIVMGWMLGESTDLEQLLEAQLLANVLLDNSASPLLHALETTHLGLAPSPLCGLEESMREMVFCCGIEGSETEHVDALEKLVLEVLTTVAEQGVAQDRLEAVLHQLEFHQREVTGDGFPYGLQLIMQALGSATHYNDPIALLNLDPVIDSLRQQILDPDYIRQLARKLLLDNPHRVTLTLTPDRELSARQTTAECERLDALKAQLNPAAQQAIVKTAADLVQRQQQVDDESILPKVELADIPAGLPELKFASSKRNGIEISAYGQGTNGVVYQQVVASLPHLSANDLQFLPAYTSMLTEMGLGDSSYLEAQHRQAATVGAISAFTSMRGKIDDAQAIDANFILSSKALHRNAKAQLNLMHDTLKTARFDETARIGDLISQQRARREQAVTGNGHGLAMAAASAGMSPLAQLNHHQSGMAGIKALRELDEELRDPKALDLFAQKLAEVHAQITAMPVQLLTIAEAEKIDLLANEASALWADSSMSASPQPFSLTPIRDRVGEMWVTNTQVNFCARAYPTVSIAHPDAAALVVLGGFLRNGFLHRAIREQGGAYGGGASQESGIAAFRFYSYRDPRMAETLGDFDRAVDWMLDTKHEYRPLEEAILGVISSLDSPGSPAGEAKQHFHNRLFGRSHAQREQFRAHILAVSLEDLQRVTATYLRPELASTAIITGLDQRETSEPLREELSLALREL